MRFAFSLLVLGSLVSAWPVTAQEENALSVTPPGNFQISGMWTCEGSFANGHVHRSTFTGAAALAGKWIELTEQDVEPATGYLAKYLIGVDTQHKRIVEFDANNFGAATYTSDEGWKNGVLTMTSAVSTDPKAPYSADRFLYTIAGQDAFTMDWQVSRSAAAPWKAADHLACKRKPA